MRVETLRHPIHFYRVRARQFGWQRLTDSCWSAGRTVGPRGFTIWTPWLRVWTVAA